MYLTANIFIDLYPGLAVVTVRGLINQGLPNWEGPTAQVISGSKR
jgi:hypothetical protein